MGNARTYGKTCYDPFVNDITFPAAILQAPFYSIKQTRSENLGGIGAVLVMKFLMPLIAMAQNVTKMVISITGGQKKTKKD